MNPTKPFLLISNDDGVSARGINYLMETLRPVADIFVMAPDGPRSGMGCAISSATPIRYKTLRKEPGLTVCACSGTPSDCIKLALEEAIDRRPDLIVAGINHGNNASINAHYSGTMGAAFEGALQGIPSIAFSLCDESAEADFTPLHDYLIDLMFKAIAMGMPPYTCLNVNFPKRPKFEGVRICSMSHNRWINEFQRCEHPRGGEYYWLVGESKNLEPENEQTDTWALEHGYVAITPTQADVTAYGMMDMLKACL